MQDNDLVSFRFFAFPASSFRTLHHRHALPAVSCAKLHKEKRTRAYRFSGGNPAFPAQWFYGLLPCSPRRRIRLVTVVGGLKACRSPVGSTSPPPSLTPATGARTTRLCRTQPAPFVLRAVVAHGSKARPATTLARRRFRVHRIPSRVRDDRERPSSRDGMARVVGVIWGKREAGIFSLLGLDG